MSDICHRLPDCSVASLNAVVRCAPAETNQSSLVSLWGNGDNMWAVDDAIMAGAATGRDGGPLADTTHAQQQQAVAAVVAYATQFWWPRVLATLSPAATVTHKRDAAASSQLRSAVAAAWQGIRMISSAWQQQQHHPSCCPRIVADRCNSALCLLLHCTQLLGQPTTAASHLLDDVPQLDHTRRGIVWNLTMHLVGRVAFAAAVLSPAGTKLERPDGMCVARCECTGAAGTMTTSAGALAFLSATAVNSFQLAGDHRGVGAIVDNGVGGIAALRTAIRTAAASCVGSAWVWLLWDPRRAMLIVRSTSGAESPSRVHPDCVPLFGCDVFEHQYIDADFSRWASIYSDGLGVDCPAGDDGEDGLAAYARHVAETLPVQFIARILWAVHHHQPHDGRSTTTLAAATSHL